MIRLARAKIGAELVSGEIIGETFQPIVGSFYGDRAHAGEALPLSSVALAIPLESPRLIAVIGGFRSGPESAERRPPRWVPKDPNSPVGDQGDIAYPPVLTEPLWAEAELAVVVGSTLSRASRQEALEGIFGWTVCNDVTAPELGAAGDWSIAKSLDGFAALGPWIRTDLSEKAVLNGLAITCTVNGSVVQTGNTARLLYAPSEMLSDISQKITLFPGDVVTMGTPPPPPEVHIGDHIVAAVDQIGTLTNRIVATSAAS